MMERDRLPKSTDRAGLSTSFRPTTYVPAALSPQREDTGEGEDDAAISHFAMLYQEYGLEDDSRLAPDAIELKRKVLAALSPAPTEGMKRSLPTRDEIHASIYEAFGDIRGSAAGRSNIADRINQATDAILRLIEGRSA